MGMWGKLATATANPSTLNDTPAVLRQRPRLKVVLDRVWKITVPQGAIITWEKKKHREMQLYSGTVTINITTITNQVSKFTNKSFQNNSISTANNVVKCKLVVPTIVPFITKADCSSGAVPMSAAKTWTCFANVDIIDSPAMSLTSILFLNPAELCCTADQGGACLHCIWLWWTTWSVHFQRELNMEWASQCGSTLACDQYLKLV